MEGITASVYKGVKEYWRKRRGYQRLNESGRRRRNRVELGTTRTRKGGRFWRWRIKVAPKVRITRIPSPKKLLVWLRDAYVRMMLGLANSRMMSMSASASGYGYGLGHGGGGGGGGANSYIAAMGGFGRGPPKEYDEKMIVQIYKSLMMAPGQFLSSGDASRIASEIACRR